MIVPSSTAELDPTWLTRALARAPAFAETSIVGVESTRVGEGYGLDGKVFRLALETRGGAPPASIVAKLARAKPARAEISFYERIAPELPIRLPAFHAGLLDPESDRAVLLLEDLAGAEQGDAVIGATPAQAETVLGREARFHAAFLDVRADALDLPLWEGREERLAAQVAERQGRFLERYGSRIGERARALVPRLAGLLPDLVSRLSGEPRTLVHGDLHLDNVLFLSTGEPVILDWTLASRGPAVVDVARLFVEGMTAETRREHGDALLAAYVEARAEAGAPCPPSPDVAELVGAAVIWHFAWALTWAGAEDPGFGMPRVRAIVESLVTNAAAAAVDADGGRVRPRRSGE